MKLRIVWRVREPMEYDTGEVKTYWWKHSTYSPTACDGSCRPLEGICNPIWWIEALVGWLRFRIWGYSNPKSYAGILRYGDTVEPPFIPQRVEPILDEPGVVGGSVSADLPDEDCLGDFVSTRAVNRPLNEQNDNDSGSVPADLPQAQEEDL